jgi:dipeptidyl aminopeptidase/acylaminoacyl peptidase
MRLCPPLLAAVACALVGHCLAQSAVQDPGAHELTAYRQPSAAMLAVLDAPALPQHSLSPDQTLLALITLRRHRPLADLARPVTRLAGEQLDANARGRALINPIESLLLRPVSGGADRAVLLPAGGGFHTLRWSPDGRHLLLQRRTEQGTELWASAVDKPVLRKLDGLRLNQVLERDIAWLGAAEFIVPAVPDRPGGGWGKGQATPPPQDLPSGPTVQESMARNSPERTLQNLLQNPQDDALFAHLATSQLRRVNLVTGASRAIGEPGLFSSVQTVGNGAVLLVEQLLRPFSYQVEWDGFARRVALLDSSSGQLVHELGSVKLKQGVPVGGVVTGPRQFWASPLADGTVYWVEALDDGDPRKPAAYRDRLMRLAPPYTAPPQEALRATHRLASLAFVDLPQRALVTEFDRDRVWVTTDLVALDGGAPAQRWQDRSWRDRYGDPGAPMTRTLAANGRSVVRIEAGGVLMAGAGAGPAGERPFLDRFDIATRSTTRLFQASQTHQERALAWLAQGPALLTSRETFAEPPNLVLRSGPGLAQMQALTNFGDPTPSLRGIQRERVRFKRADGVDLSFWLYLPPGHKGKNAGDARPTFVWAYPQEFTDAGTASQVSGSASRFNSFGGTNPLMLLLDGYVVLMDATMPVVGDPKTVNDSFIEQIVANAKAIVDQAVALGVTQRDKVVVGGHSYGAFMTANLLAHSNVFKAGIARSGAYNRTLTPFGFQAERRTLWEAPDSYLKLSPFLVADKIKQPILLIHGESDDNPGTFPLQSQRLYQALAGTGGSVRYVALPHEGHGYTARESQGHVLWEMSDWMRRQVGPGVGLAP